MTKNNFPQYTDDMWRIFIRDLKVMLPCGVKAWEKGGPQEVLVTIEMWGRADEKFTPEKELSDAIDYSRVADVILKEWPKRSHIPLLEQWAEELVALCFEDEKVTEVKVSLTKTAPYPEAAGGVGVSLFRRR